MPTMTGLLSLLATGVLATLGVWLLGGVVLRVGGVLLVAVGLLSTAATGSPLARRVFHEALPRQLDPTRGWGIPNVPPEGR